MQNINEQPEETGLHSIFFFDVFKCKRGLPKKKNRKMKNNLKKLSLRLINEWICFTAGLLTRNNSLDFELSQAKYSQKKLFNTLIRNFGYCGNQSPLTAMQMSSGNPSMSNNTQVITLDTFKKFLETRQIESKSDCEIKMIIEVRNSSPQMPSIKSNFVLHAASRARSIPSIGKST